jgi:hypothetical protein
LSAKYTWKNDSASSGEIFYQTQQIEEEKIPIAVLNFQLFDTYTTHNGSHSDVVRHVRILPTSEISNV